MRPPPLLLGAALLFWGWRIDLLWAGALCGALIELPHAVKGRWDFSDKEFNRLWDVCTIIFIAVAGYLRFSEELTSGAYKFFQWMPGVFFLMALGYVFSTRDAVPMKAFSWFLRRKGAERADRPVAFGWVYFIVCIVAASATNIRDPWFFFGFAALAGWAFWSIRPRRIPDWAWVGLFAVVAASAYTLQARAQDAQSYFEGKLTELLAQLGRRDFDANQSRTAMGRSGELRLSGRIVMKVTPESGPLPERLRQAVFSRFENTTWRGGGNRAFEPVAIEADTTTWTLVSNAQASGSVRITQRAQKELEILALPHGAVQLRDLLSVSVGTNMLGAVRAEDNPGLMNFAAITSASKSLDLAWRQYDLDLPEDEEAALEAIAEELNLPDSMPDAEKAAAIDSFFTSKFRYTTYQEARRDRDRRTPLSQFLLKTRAGHCEHFASATVLLLRYYKIPARYVVGYALTGEEREGDSLVVRERDGHAWAMAWLNGRWTEVDTTPADWSQREKNELPFYQQLKDSWGRFTFGFLEWRWLGDWGFIRIAAPWLIAPMVGFLAWRIFGRKMSFRKRPARELRPWPGADSEFFALERRLAKLGLARNDSESAREWFDRVSTHSPAAQDLLPQLVALHQRYRFDPAGLNRAERERLREIAKASMANL